MKMQDYCAYTSIEQRDALGKVIERPEREFPYSFSLHCKWVADEKDLEKSLKLESSGSVYSDRMYQSNSDKYNQACRDVFGNEGQYFDKRTPKNIEKMLRQYFGIPSLVLTHIYKECNLSSGYPTWAFTYRYK